MGLYLIADSGSFLGLERLLPIIQMFAGLGVVIFVHELGHFLVAKACGVKCEKFYVGFDFFDIKIANRVIIPRSLIKYQWGETEYGIGIIPLGGYVKMLGQDDDPTKYGQEMERSKTSDKPEDTASSDEQDEAPDTAQVSEDSENDTNAAPSEATESTEETGEEEFDPRSYQAKKVWQRMAIISAGVIMNLIFAVVFATIAYRFGVQNSRAIVGRVVPGGVAWEKGLRPGDKIIQLQKSGSPSEHIRFRDDLLNAVVMNGNDQPMSLKIRRSSGDEEWLEMTPKKIAPDAPFESLGINSYQTTKLSSQTPVVEGLPASKADPSFEPSDVVVAVGGKELDEFTFGFDGHPVKDRGALDLYLAQHPDDPVEFTVRRKTSAEGEPDAFKEVEITVAPNPMRRLGLVMKMGPVKSVQDDSPAHQASIITGDIIEKLNGEPVDPITFPHILRRIAQDSDPDNDEIELLIRRGGKTKTVSVTPREPTSAPGSAMAAGAPYPCDELGVAYSILNEVQSVDSKCSVQDKIKPGDEIVEVEFVSSDRVIQKKEKEFGLIFSDRKKTKEAWPIFHDRLQIADKETKIRVTYKQGEKTQTAELQPYTSKQWFYEVRGIVFQAYEPVRVANSWGEAARLGFRETAESGSKVIVFLGKLISGKISVTNLGGPLSIAYVATAEASEGPSRLLIFLTLLSANLAVVNFLPIPVLDGGHMMFLTYEAVTGKRPSEKWFVRLSVGGLAFILSLMVFVVSLDLFRFLG